MKLQILGIVLGILFGVPAIAAGSSFTYSLIQGKSPDEAIAIIANQVDSLIGRVSVLEDEHAQLSEEVSENKSETELEIERLKLENENLRLKTDTVLSETEGTRANEARREMCSELSSQISAKEEMVRAPFDAKMKPLQEERKELIEQYNLLKAADRPDEFEAAREKLEAKKDEIDAVSEDMDKAIEALRSTPEMQNLMNELNENLCA